MLTLRFIETCSDKCGTQWFYEVGDTEPHRSATRFQIHATSRERAEQVFYEQVVPRYSTVHVFPMP